MLTNLVKGGFNRSINCNMPMLKMQAQSQMSLLHFGMPLAHFSTAFKLKFGTDNNAYSNRYHAGLFHGKTHGQRKKRVFSMKYRIETQKPNIFKKRVYSHALDKHFKLWVSTTARKSIIKQGNLDNYLVNTNRKYLDSKFGLYLKQLVKEQRKDPENFVLPSIPGT
jgi:ribosomal protein L28